MPTSIIVGLGAIGARALTPRERLLSFLNTAIFANLILVGLNRARKKPQAPGVQAVTVASTFSVRQPISPWQVVIGQRRVGGTITFIFLSTDKKYLHMVVTLACHVSEEIGDIWLDDEVITPGMLSGSGVVTSGRFSRITPTVHLEHTEAASYTAAHAVASVQSVTGTTQDTDGAQVSYPLADVSPSAPGPGQYKRSGDTFTFNSAFLGIDINYTENVVEPVCRIKKSLGGEAGQPFADLVAESEAKWVDADRQTGHTKIYIRFDTSMLQGSSPSISAVLKGAKLYDPRTGLTTWSANAALAVLYYLTNSELGRSAALAQIDSASFIAAANVCDESVSLAGGGSEARYAVNGAFLTSERPVDVLEALVGAIGGSTASLTRVGGTWRLFAGAYEAATLTLAERDFAGAVQIDKMPPRDKWANGAKGIFVNPASNWQPTDFPAVAPTTPYLAEDGGEAIYADFDFSKFITSSGQAQRIARIEVRQARSGMTLTASYKLSAWRAMTGHSVAQDFAKYGFSGKEFTVQRSGFTVIQGQDGPALGVQLVLRETNSSIFSWSAEDQAQGTPPATSLPNPFSVAAPGAPTVVETLYETSGSAGVKSRATVSWTAVVDPLVKSYEVAWKKVSDPDYRIVPVPNGTSLDVDDLQDGLFLFAVRAFNGIAKSAWSPYTQKVLLGLTEPPSNPAGFSVVASNGFAVARWDLSSDLDVKIGGRAIIRHSPLTAGATWEAGILISGNVDLPGFPGDTIMSPPLPLKTGTYLLKFRDSSGNYSTNAASFVATEGMISGFTTLVTIQEDAAFGGTLTDTVVSSSKLQLASVNLLQRTEEFDNAYWTKVTSTVTANSTTAPDGAATADTLTVNAGGGDIQSGTVSAAASTTYTISIFAKKNNVNFLTMQFTDAAANAVQAWFNVNTGAVGSTVNIGAAVAGVPQISVAANGFYRCSVPVTTHGTPANYRLDVWPASADLGNSANTDAMYLWGAQVEKSAILSAYDKLVSTRVGNIVVPSGNYAFTSTDNRGSIAMRRFEGSVKALSIDTGVLIDSMPDVDDWDSVDGGAVNDCNAQLLASVSDDNITYSPFTPFHVADFRGQYAKFRLDLTSANPVHNIQVSELRVAIKTP